MKQRIILNSLTALVALGCLAGPALSDEAADGLARAKENLVKYTAKPEFVAPGDPFDAKSCAAGKKMMSIPNNSGNPFLKGIIDRMKAAGAEVGLDVREWENQGQPSQWVQGVELAIRDKYDIIDLISGIDPGTIQPQLEAAKAAGVKVMTSHFYDPSFEQNPVVSSSLTIGFGEIGTILADWSTVATEGKANIAIIVSNEVPPTIPLVANFKEQLAKNCPQCKIVQEINVGVTEWGTKIQPAVQTRGAGQSRHQRRDPDLQFDVAVRRAGIAPCRQDRPGQARHFQWHAVRARLHPVRRGRHGHRRKPRLDCLCDRRRPPSRCLRPEVADRAQRAVLSSSTSRTPPRPARRRSSTPATAMPTSRASASSGASTREYRWLDLPSATADIPAGAPRCAPCSSVANLSKTFGGAKALTVHLRRDAGRGSRPSRQERLGQVDAGQDPRRLPRARRGRHAAFQRRSRSACRSEPGDYRRLGMAFVHQNLGLVPSLTVLENLRLVPLTSARRAFINWAEEHRRARQALKRFGLDLDPHERVDRLTPGAARAARHRSGLRRGRGRARRHAEARPRSCSTSRRLSCPPAASPSSSRWCVRHGFRHQRHLHFARHRRGHGDHRPDHGAARRRGGRRIDAARSDP